MKLTGWFLAGLALFWCSGCSNHDIILKKQTEMEARIEQLVQSHAASNAKIADLGGEVAELQTKVRQNSAALDEMKPGMKELRASLEAVQTKQQVDAARPADAPPVAAPPPVAPPVAAKIEVVNQDTVPADRETKAQDTYMKAFGLFSSGKYSEAVGAFESFIAAFPESEYAGNARYWIGECHYTQKEYVAAMDAFKKVISDYPKGRKVPDAMLKLGLTQISMKDSQGARDTLKSLIEKYPKTEAAAKARERLPKL